MEQPTYEFTEAHNQTLQILGSRMKWVGILFIVIGAVYGLVGVLGLAEGAPAFVFMLYAVIFILIGIWTRTAGSSFSLIVETAGSDIPHLMDALESLRKLYNLAFWLMIVGLGLALIAILLRGVMAGS
ncbi:MAG: hypothetical protein ACE5H0_05490 [Bacteroidota bacterium]